MISAGTNVGWETVMKVEAYLRHTRESMMELLLEKKLAVLRN